MECPSHVPRMHLPLPPASGVGLEDELMPILTLAVVTGSGKGTELGPLRPGQDRWSRGWHAGPDDPSE